jgi:hypothetical protein
MLGVLSATLSAMAGVYTEFLMKQNDDSLYWQNVQLYSFGVLFNASALTIDDFQHGFLHGFWPHTMFNGACGLAGSWYTMRVEVVSTMRELLMRVRRAPQGITRLSGAW